MTDAINQRNARKLDLIRRLIALNVSNKSRLMNIGMIVHAYTDRELQIMADHVSQIEAAYHDLHA